MMRGKILVLLIVGFVIVSPVFAQNNGAKPVGANTAQDLYSPGTAGHGGFTTSRGGASAGALNPAAEGDAQRIIFDIGYLGLPAFGRDSGYGLGAINLGAIFPTKYAVFGGSLHFLRSPFKSFPVETSFGGNFNAAKEIYPGMNLGLGLNIGYNTVNAFTISGDLGFRYNMGDLGPLENFTWAFTARSLGKSMIPPMLTPAAGVSFDFLRLKGAEGKADPLRLSVAADLMAPTFQNLAAKLGLSILVADMVKVSAGTQFNLKESLDGKGPSPIPSIGVGVIRKLRSGGSRIIGGTLPTDGELDVNLAAKPLYDGIWAMGGGVTWTVGMADKNPPVIKVDYSEVQWISPNNDGKSDYLEIPVTITDAKHIVEWVFEIKDEWARPVRVYRNKELRPETQGMRNIIQRITAVNAGVEVPSVMRWDGIMDSGELAPDGTYFFTISAKDENENASSVGPFEVNVRCTPPYIDIVPFDGEMNIFSPGGGGGRDTLTITQSGSREDLWEGGIYDALGVIAKTISFIDKEPGTIVWDGTDDSGSIVPDGVYNYRIGATDKAQNSAEASLENILVNTIRPIVGLTIADAYFSPNDDGTKDNMIFNLSVPVREGISNWELQIKNFSGEVLRRYTGTSNIPARLEFDGRDNMRRLLPEDMYSATLLVSYRNGYNSTANSPTFSLDITPPWASVRIDDSDYGTGVLPVFSPNNTGIKDEIILIHDGSNELSWVGEVRRSGERIGNSVRTFRFSGTPPRRHSWNGITNAGALAPDGTYTYTLFGTDPAGNIGRSNSVDFELNTKETPVFITTDLRAFSPNGDGVKDAINIIPQLQERDGINTWRIDVLNAATGTGSVIRSFEGRGAPPTAVSWDGRTGSGSIAPDGTYEAKVDIEYRSGNRPTALSPAFGLRTVPPQGEASAPYTLFAPNGNGNRDTLPIYVRTEGDDEWSAVISGGGSSEIRSWNWTGRPASSNIIWDGKDFAGNIVPDGTYTFTLSSTDEAGNSTRKSINDIRVDARIPRIFLTASANAIAPKVNQAEAMRFNVMATPSDGVDFWKLELRDENNLPVRTLPAVSGGRGSLPSSIPWNGADERGGIREGRYTPVLTVNYTKGDVVNASAPSVLVDTSGPILNFRSQPQYFSPDNDGVDDELFIYLTARDVSPIAEWSLEIRETEGTRQLFYRISGRGNPSERIIWDGRSNRGELVQGAMDYEYTYSAVDALGNASSTKGTITTDVLVIRDGDMLRIQIPSITFRANYADFIGIPKERLDNNIRVLRRVAEILNKFRDYRITVEGHANPVLGTAREETETLMPLSLARARFVIEQLGGLGVNRNRLSPTGRGGSINVASPQDQDNSWKNRRVEFLLNK